MDHRTPAYLLGDALGGLDARGTETVARVLEFLGISTSSRDRVQADKLALHISLDAEAAQGDVHVEFDSVARRWRLVNPSPWPPADATNCELDRGSPLGDNGIDSGGAREQRLWRKKAIVGVEGQGAVEDWTERLPASEHAEFLKSADWGASVLGPMRVWPLLLRLMTHKMLADPRPACLYWGGERVAIYNEPFVLLAASRHPAMMGSTAKEALPATWPFLSQMFDEIDRSGIAFATPEFEMSVEKTSGFIEEAWYDGVFMPVRDEQGCIKGFYNSGFEITNSKMAERRSRLLHQIMVPPNFHQVTLWQHIVTACEPFERDIPLLVVYSAVAQETAQSKSCSLQLEGVLGIEKGHPAIPERLEILDAGDGFMPAFRMAKAQGAPILLEMPGGTLPEFLREGVQWRGFKEPATHIIITPLFVTGLIAGFMVVGLNPRRPYDDALEHFVIDLGRASTSVLSSNISFEQARAREAQLSKEITDRERFVRQLAEVATVGIYNFSVDGALTWANSKYYEFTGTSRRPEDAYNMAFLEHILEKDRLRAGDCLRECRGHQIPKTIEYQIARTWTPPGSTTEEHCWIMASVAPNIQDGQVTGVLGCLTDISHLKWAERLQTDMAEAAKEAKQQQERFIDITSHEMRNPLSAILQSADSIATGANRGVRYCEGDRGMTETLESMRESAQTILFCAAHQKRIIDDILTVSKIESSMMTITPVLVEPSVVVRQAIQMFQEELTAYDILTTFTLEQSYHILGVKWVHCDPSRLTQILINLLTNAIKFTKTAQKREISVCVGASNDAPPPDMSALQWFPSGQTRKDIVKLSDSGTGEDVYITFSVKDTGQGISSAEMALLFNRFCQANRKTHIQYGGSGLGLFISRELTEMQGGMIGSSSIPDQGSTFAFYIKARKATPVDIEASRQLVYPSNSRRSSAANAAVNRRRSSANANHEAHLEVLLVEDNIVNQKVLSKQLQRLGCTVHIANHGVEALDFLQTTRFWRPNGGEGLGLDYVLLDWEMPIMDGLECTRRLRDWEQQGLLTEHLVVVATTANARKEQVQMAFDAGIDDFLAKPFKVSELMKKLDSLR